MEKITIRIYNETEQKGIPRKALQTSITSVLQHFGKRNAQINIILTDDKTILEMNKKFLNHNYITDVISFDLSESEELILGEIYICLPQAERQAKEYKTTFKNELLRLAIHGILHILGFDDSTSKEKKEMTRLENYFLNHQ